MRIKTLALNSSVSFVFADSLLYSGIMVLSSRFDRYVISFRWFVYVLSHCLILMPFTLPRVGKLRRTSAVFSWTETDRIARRESKGSERSAANGLRFIFVGICVMKLSISFLWVYRCYCIARKGTRETCNRGGIKKDTWRKLQTFSICTGIWGGPPLPAYPSYKIRLKLHVLFIINSHHSTKSFYFRYQIHEWYYSIKHCCRYVT